MLKNIGDPRADIFVNRLETPHGFGGTNKWIVKIPAFLHGQEKIDFIMLT